MKMKSILFVSNRLGGGGSERVLTTLANALSEKGFQIRIAYFLESERYYIRPEIECIHIWGRNRINRIIMLRKLINSMKPENIISFEYHVNMQAIVSALFKRVNVIVSERNDPQKKGGNFPVSVIRNVLYAKSNWLVCQTIDAKEYFPALIQKKSVVIPNPLSANLPRKDVTIRKKVVVNFCRLQKQKNLELLIDAFLIFQKDHESYTLEIYGDGPERDRLNDYILSCDSKGTINLFPSTNDIHQRVIDAAMFVSSSDYEGLSNSMIEAMALGIPTIATDCPIGGAKMMIENMTNGILVTPGDKVALADAMAQIADNNFLAQTVSKNACKIREKLSLNSITERWLELLR